MLSVLKKYSVERAFFGHIHGRYSIPKKQTYSSVDFSLASADFLDFRPQIILPKNQA
jgi:predicted phosphohydrolase